MQSVRPPRPPALRSCDVGPDDRETGAIEELGHHDSASIVARFDPRSRVKAADDVTIAVDTTRIQFFDLDTGLAIST